MNRRWPLVAAVVMLAAAPALPAQSRTTISIIPTGGVFVPAGDWVDTLGITLTAGPGVYLGAIAEVSFNKSFSITGQVTRTLGAMQTVEAVVDTGGGNLTFTADMATTQFAASVVFRPLGRLPSGAPNKIYLEAGGGLISYAVSRGLQDPSDPNANWASSSAMAMGGAGLSFPAGPRFSIQLFGRANYLFSKYKSDAIDPLEGKSGLLLQFGVGLRVGR